MAVEGNKFVAQVARDLDHKSQHTILESLNWNVNNIFKNC